MIKLKSLQYFLAAAENGSFAEAGKQLRISATSIGYAIDNLEHKLKTKLFVRKPAIGLELTPDGRILLKKCRNLLFNLEDIENAFGDRQDNIKGKLVVGCQEGLSWSLVPRAIQKLSQIHPELEITIKTTWMDTRSELLDNGEVDILFTFLTVGKEISKRYTSTLLCNPSTCAMMRKGHPLDNGGQDISLYDLAKYPQIMINDGPAFALFMGMYHKLSLSPPIHMFMNTSVGAQACVAHCDSVSLRILYPAHNLSPLGEKIVFPKVQESVIRPDMVALTNTTQSETSRRKQNAFIDVCKDLFKSGDMRNHIYY